jgi:hypothetical protein
MNAKFLSAVVAFSLTCTALATAQKRYKINLHEREAKVHKLLAEKAAKEGKTLSHAQTATSSGTVTYWSGTINYDGYQFPFTMLGTNPTKRSATTVIPVYVVPVKLVLPDGSVWDPAAVSVPNRANAIDATINSPIFGRTNWNNGGVNLGYHSTPMRFSAAASGRTCMGRTVTNTTWCFSRSYSMRWSGMCRLI